MWTGKDIEVSLCYSLQYHTLVRKHVESVCVCVYLVSTYYVVIFGGILRLRLLCVCQTSCSAISKRHMTSEFSSMLSVTTLNN